MKELTVERVLKRIAELEKAESCNMISIHCEFELSCLRKLIVLMGYDIHPNALMQTTIKLFDAEKRIAELERQYENRSPTEWAYNQVCAALQDKRGKLLLAQNFIDEVTARWPGSIELGEYQDYKSGIGE